MKVYLNAFAGKSTTKQGQPYFRFLGKEQETLAKMTFAILDVNQDHINLCKKALDNKFPINVEEFPIEEGALVWIKVLEQDQPKSLGTPEDFFGPIAKKKEAK